MQERRRRSRCDRELGRPEEVAVRAVRRRPRAGGWWGARIRSLVRTLQADASSSARRRTATARPRTRQSWKSRRYTHCLDRLRPAWLTRLRVTLRRALQSFIGVAL